MKRVSLLDETFDPCQASNYDLLVAPERFGIKVAVHDLVRKKFIALIAFPYPIADDTDWQDAFAALFRTYPWLAAHFRSVRIGWRGRNYTLLPKDFFVPAEAKILLSRLSYVREYDTLYYNRIATDIILLFAIPSELIQALVKAFTHFTVLHQETTLLRLALQHFRKSPCVLVHMVQDFVSASLVSSGQLLQHNAFDAYEPTDVLYYVAAFMQAPQAPTNLTYRIVGNEIHLPSQPKEERFLNCRTTDESIREYYPRYEHAITPPDHSFAYSLEPYREATIGLFSLLFGD